jgi:hypothetical protein
MKAMTRREWIGMAAVLAGGVRAGASASQAGQAAAPPADARGLEDAARRAADVIRVYSGEGFHRTATPVDRASADRLAARIREAGADGRLEPFELSRVDPVAAFLETGGRRIDGLPMFDGAFTDAKGIRGTIGAPGSGKAIALTKVNPTGEAVLKQIRAASRERAIIAVTTGQNPGLSPVNAAFFTQPFGPPVLQIGSDHADAIERAADGDERVRLVCQVARRPATAFNVAAEIRGTRSDLTPVCVMTPRSGWYRNASERGGGLACWLEALSAAAKARPLRTVRFVASSGHELGHLGLHAYLKRTPARDALVWVHLGANIGAATGPTVLTCSDERAETAALRALGAHGAGDVSRTPAAQVGGEAGTIRQEGGRFISFIGRNAWFHHPRDLWPDTVDVQAIARFARAVSDLTVALANSSEN